MELGDTTNNTTAWSNPILTHELHHSHIETLVGRCAKKFEWEYLIQPQVQRGPLSNDLQMNMGSAAHEVISTVIGGTLKPLGQIMDELYDKWVIPCISDPAVEAKAADEYQRNCFAALEYVTTHFDRRQVNSEKQFVIPEVSNLSPILKGISSDWRFAGSMDLIQFGEGQAAIADLKFRGRSNYQSNKGSSQAPMYALAALYYGYIPTFAYVEVVKGKVIEQKIELTEGKYDWLFIKARQAIDEIESGRFPISPNGWWCSNKYCKYWAVCRGKYDPEDQLEAEE
jgi:hypothetical protein